jgi:hypothetical protein
MASVNGIMEIDGQKMSENNPILHQYCTCPSDERGTKALAV